MTAHTEREGLRAHVRDLERQIARLRAENMAARDRALEKAAALVRKFDDDLCEDSTALSTAAEMILELKGTKP